MAYGGSVAGVAANELALSAQQRAAQEAQLRMLLAQMEQRREQGNRNREFSFREQNAERDDKLRRDYFNFSQQQEQQRRAEWEREMLLREQEADYRMTQPTAADINREARGNRDAFDVAWQLADEGLGEDSPSLTPEQNAAVRIRRDTSRRELSAGRDYLNRLNTLDNYIGLSTEAKKAAPSTPGKFRSIARFGPPPFTYLNFGMPDAKTATKEDIDRDVLDWSRERASVATAAQGFLQSRGGTGGLIRDEATGMWDVPWKAAAPAGTNAPAAATPRVNPMPATKELLRQGEWYETRRGPAMWDGTNFVQSAQ